MATTHGNSSKPGNVGERLVMHSLESALPIVLSSSTSTAIPQIPEKKNRKGLVLPSSPHSRRRSESAERHKGWSSPLRRKKKDRKGVSRSANSSPIAGGENFLPSNAACNLPEATPVNSLPGGRPAATSTASRDSDIPTIMVSPEEEEEQQLWRTLSQGSSTVTSGHQSTSEPVLARATLSVCLPVCSSVISSYSRGHLPLFLVRC